MTERTADRLEDLHEELDFLKALMRKYFDYLGLMEGSSFVEGMNLTDRERAVFKDLGAL